MLMAFGTMIGLGAVWMTRLGSRSHTPPAQPQPAVLTTLPTVPPATPPAQ